MTNGEFVSRVINGVRALSKDEHISQRYVLSIGRNKAQTYIAQKLEDRTIYREDNLQRIIECFPLKKDSTVKCPMVEFRRCKTLMKSKRQLPEVIFSKYGASVFQVTSIDGTIEFDYVTPSDFAALKRREFNTGQKYTISNLHVIIPDFEVEAVNVSLITLFDKEASDACDCNKSNKCKSVWDYQFICPDKLLEPIVTETINEVMSSWRRLPVDENPNMDVNIKTRA